MADIDSSRNSLDTKRIDEIIGAKGETSPNGVHKVIVAQMTKMHGHEMGAAMGVNTWAAFAGRDPAAGQGGEASRPRPGGGRRVAEQDRPCSRACRLRDGRAADQSTRGRDATARAHAAPLTGAAAGAGALPRSLTPPRPMPRPIPRPRPAAAGSRPVPMPRPGPIPRPGPMPRPEPIPGRVVGPRWASALGWSAGAAAGAGSRETLPLS